MVIRRKNVAGVGSYMGSLLANVLVLDTLVDRICAVGAGYQVTAEPFHECAIDAPHQKRRRTTESFVRSRAYADCEALIPAG